MTQSFRVFSVVNFALISLLFDFSTQHFIFWSLSIFLLFPAIQYDIIACAAFHFLCIIITISPFIQCESPCEEKISSEAKNNIFICLHFFFLFFYYFTSENFSLLLLPNLRDCMSVLVSENLCMMRKNFFTISFFPDSFQQRKLHLNCDQGLFFDILLQSMTTQNIFSPPNKTGNHNLAFQVLSFFFFLARENFFPFQ